MEENLCRLSQCLNQASHVVQELVANSGGGGGGGGGGRNVAAVVNDDEASKSTNAAMQPCQQWDKLSVGLEQCL